MLDSCSPHTQDYCIFIMAKEILTLVRETQWIRKTLCEGKVEGPLSRIRRGSDATWTQTATQLLDEARASSTHAEALGPFIADLEYVVDTYTESADCWDATLRANDRFNRHLATPGDAVFTAGDH
jgi:hypothetical protein